MENIGPNEARGNFANADLSGIHVRGRKSFLIGVVILCSMTVLDPSIAHATNYKKDFCGSNDYVGNAGGKQVPSSSLRQRLSNVIQVGERPH